MVRTFSRKYPGYHPEAGKPTYFVEKIVKGFAELGHPVEDIDELAVSGELDDEVYESCKPKFHTVRAGHWFKTGDMLSPRVWTGRPYHSQQLKLAPDIKVICWNFEIRNHEVFVDGIRMPADTVGIIAMNDGLSFTDFMHWFKFPEPFDGQIICWDQRIEYDGL